MHETESLTEVQYLALALLPDFTAPLAVILPEVRTLLRDQRLTADRFDADLRHLEEAGLVHVTTDVPGAGARETTEEDRSLIVQEYADGNRDITQTAQLFDRIDLWLEITDAGRQYLIENPRDVPTFPLEK